jgi:hypothetical protein
LESQLIKIHVQACAFRILNKMREICNSDPFLFRKLRSPLQMNGYCKIHCTSNAFFFSYFPASSDFSVQMYTQKSEHCVWHAPRRSALPLQCVCVLFSVSIISFSPFISHSFLFQPPHRIALCFSNIRCCVRFLPPSLAFALSSSPRAARTGEQPSQICNTHCTHTHAYTLIFPLLLP